MQNIIDERIFTELYNAMYEEFKSANSEQLYKLYLETESKMKDWKYATDTYYSIEPYDVEMANLKRGRPLKSAHTNNPSIRVNKFGFDEKNDLIVSEFPLGNDPQQYGYYTNCNLHREGSVKTYVIHRYVENQRPSSKVCIRIFKTINDTTKVSLGVRGISNDQWYVQVYHYSDGVLQKVERYDPIFNLTVEYT